jgi:anti-anti-sigma factor
MDFQSEPILVTKIPDGFRVAVLGSVHGNVAWLEDDLKKILAAKPKLVELDLSKMHFASSIGLSVFINFRNALINNGGSIKTLSVQEPVLGTIKYACLQDVLGIDDKTQVVKSTK